MSTAAIPHKESDPDAADPFQSTSAHTFHADAAAAAASPNSLRDASKQLIDPDRDVSKEESRLRAAQGDRILEAGQVLGGGGGGTSGSRSPGSGANAKANGPVGILTNHNSGGSSDSPKISIGLAHGEKDLDSSLNRQGSVLEESLPLDGSTHRKGKSAQFLDVSVKNSRSIRIKSETSSGEDNDDDEDGIIFFFFEIFCLSLLDFLVKFISLWIE